MKTALPRILFLVLLLASVIAFTVAFSPSASIEQRSAAAQNPNSDNEVQLRPAALIIAQPLTPTPSVEPVSHPGSTDGIIVMSIAIVLIILFPLLLQRGLWMK